MRLTKQLLSIGYAAKIIYDSEMNLKYRFFFKKFRRILIKPEKIRNYSL